MKNKNPRGFGTARMLASKYSGMRNHFHTIDRQPFVIVAPTRIHQPLSGSISRDALATQIRHTPTSANTAAHIGA